MPNLFVDVTDLCEDLLWHVRPVPLQKTSCVLYVADKVLHGRMNIMAGVARKLEPPPQTG